MAFPYKKVLVIGATSGIGRSIAGSLVGHGCFVIGVGRRKEHLASFVQTYGTDKVATLQFDISQLDKIPSFVKRFGPLLHPFPTLGITSANPDLDCVILNSGIQRRSVFSDPIDIDMDVIQDEITRTNIKVIEIFPPAVQTELHDPKNQPDMSHMPSDFGMPLELFTKETIEKLYAGSDQIPIGYAGVAFDGWEQERQKAFMEITEKIEKGTF
ncbi:hypothetical protein DPV78_008199 [Talaromyces pinophilus]|nr:hypothetical protein DPV78_008199 [Talaromyces pinophilus]